jgi:hypothetical protein
LTGKELDDAFYADDEMRDAVACFVVRIACPDMKPQRKLDYLLPPFPLVPILYVKEPQTIKHNSRRL